MPAVPLALRNAIDARIATRHVAVELLLPRGPARAWSGVGDFVMDGKTYLGAGGLGHIEGLSNSAQLQAHEVRVTLQQVPFEGFAHDLDQQVRYASARIYAVWTDLSNRQLAKRTLFDGYVDYISSVPMQNGSVTAVLRSKALDMRRIPSAYYTDRYQREKYAQDAGFSLVRGLTDKNGAGWSPSTTGGDKVFVKWTKVGRVYTLTDTALRDILTYNSKQFKRAANGGISFPETRTERIDGKNRAAPFMALATADVMDTTDGPRAVNLRTAYTAKDGFVRMADDDGKRIVVGPDLKLYTEDGVKVFKVSCDGPRLTTGAGLATSVFRPYQASYGKAKAL